MKIFTLVLLVTSVSAAKLPDTTDASNLPNESQRQQVAAGDYTDTICRMVIEGNLSGLNDKINRGDFGNSYRSMKRLLNQLHVPNGKGCAINLMKSIHLSNSEEALKELERLQRISGQSNAIAQMRRKYPQLSQQTATHIAAFLKSLKRWDEATLRTEDAPTGTVGQ